ncbi:molybdenum ABC transporter ATP-binding protein [Kordiimonas sp. SCSIO 12610]|uniref:molybdenum ABC transporter ATP-binding protein n=1 Tax=Kordiimonas sp. SCSIO 12610 TaxID=2829597 RepID=UPI00210A653F|nr:ATP-binding cassette domain-containing protein [Kordiimonas sp. SCSIO 12610]UTW56632.1 ATP-binding cassette domain-containing protein [Kordiimonas sp. SCSIO 12610]
MNIALSADVRWEHDTATYKANFALYEGVNVLIGQSGAGKSTLSRILLGLIKPISGTITLNDTTLVHVGKGTFSPVHKRKIGWVPQDSALFPHMTVEANIRYGSKKQQSIDDILDFLSIKHLKNRNTHTLSGGEARRVAIARAIVSEPGLLILDEPTNGLDQKSKETVLTLIKKIAQTRSIPILMITHDYDEMLKLADHTILMHENLIVTEGTLEHITQHADFSQALGLKEISSILEGTFVGTEDTLWKIDVAGQTLYLFCIEPIPAINSCIRVRLSSKDIALSLQPIDGTSILNHLSCSITEINQQSDQVLVTLKLENSDQCISAQITQKSAALMQVKEGMQVSAMLKAVAVKSITSA